MGAVLRFASFLTVLHQRPIPPLARQTLTGEIMRVSILLLSLLVVLAVLSYAEAGKKKKKPVPGPCKVANCKQCNVSGKKCKKCNDGFKPQKKGKKCGPKPCEPNPCENGGKCIFNKKKKVEVCKCPELTAGDRCELRAEVLPPPEPEPEIIVDPVDPEPPAPNLAVPWRDDLRCGPNFKLPSGENAQCDPNNKNGHVCCSPQGWCGKTPAHCTCDGCIDYSPKPVPRPLPKPGSSCPASHPYVYHDGDYCCASNTEKVYTPEGERCDGGPISFTSSCCKDDQYVSCSTNICSDYDQAASCLEGDYKAYKGEFAQTKTGKNCQAWAAQSPHKHTRDDSGSFASYWSNRGETPAQAKNYCRDPDNTGGLWCYTTDSSSRWEYCNVPACESDDCMDSVSSYKGTTAVTKTGKTCQAWTAQSPHKHTRDDKGSFKSYWTNLGESAAQAKNYCRDPDNTGGLWCYTT